LFAYPLIMLVRREIRPSAKRLPLCLACIAAMAIPLYFLDKAVNANYFFLGYAPPGSPLAPFEIILGSPWYIAGYIPLLAVVWVALYLPLKISGCAKEKIVLQSEVTPNTAEEDAASREALSFVGNTSDKNTENNANMEKNITYQRSHELLLSLPNVKPQTETVPLSAAAGRILAEDVTAVIPIPPFTRSPFDGYAFIAADTASASPENPVTLNITEEIPAGTQPTIPITHGFAAKILTGAPLPDNADCTVKYEDTVFDAKTVKLTAPIKPGNIVPAGEDVKQGEIIRRNGEIVTPAALGLFASAGLREVSVYKRPKALIINTGSELVAPGETLPPAKIYSSSSYSLISALADLGIDAETAAVVRDDADEIAAAIADALKQCDIVITTGGASVGDYDYSVAASEKLGANILFWKTKIKPGGAMLASELDGKLILALAGNPGSALMALLIVARPYLARLSGRTDLFPEPVYVKLKKPIKKVAGRTRCQRGRLEIINGEAWFDEQGEQGGGVLSSFNGCDLIADIDEGTDTVGSGTLIKAYRL